MPSVTNTSTFSLEYLEAVRDVQYQWAAAFAFLVWDSILTFEEEIEYVWGMRRYLFKSFYFFFRYILLAAQIFHLIASPYLASGNASDFLCRMWYRYMIFILQLSLCIIEIVLATRVFALFNKSRKVGVFLGIMIISHSAVAVSCIAQFPEPEYFEACILPYPPEKVITSQASTIVVVQSITIGMTLFKHVVAIRLGWGRTPLLSFLVRDATSNYVTIFLLCGISLVVGRLNDLRCVAIMHWAISLISTMGCRLIVNMERFARRNIVNDEILLTSHITL